MLMEVHMLPMNFLVMQDEAYLVHMLCFGQAFEVYLKRPRSLFHLEIDPKN